MKTRTKNSECYCPQAAVRYARVLYELNVPEEAIKITREIFIQMPQLQDVLANPTIRTAQKEKVIDEIFPEEIKNFLKVVNRYQKMNLIQEIFIAYDRHCNEQNQILSAVLTCTEPPSEVQLLEMQAFLCKKYKAKLVNIDIEINQTLLGGFVLCTKNEEYDWSLKGRLNRLEQKLTRR